MIYALMNGKNVWNKQPPPPPCTRLHFKRLRKKTIWSHKTKNLALFTNSEQHSHCNVEFQLKYWSSHPLFLHLGGSFLEVYCKKMWKSMFHIFRIWDNSVLMNGNTKQFATVREIISYHGKRNFFLFFPIRLVFFLGWSVSLFFLEIIFTHKRATHRSLDFLTNITIERSVCFRVFRFP